MVWNKHLNELDLCNAILFHACYYYHWSTSMIITNINDYYISMIILLLLKFKKIQSWPHSDSVALYFFCCGSYITYILWNKVDACNKCIQIIFIWVITSDKWVLFNNPYFKNNCFHFRIKFTQIKHSVQHSGRLNWIDLYELELQTELILLLKFIVNEWSVFQRSHWSFLHVFLPGCAFPHWNCYRIVLQSLESLMQSTVRQCHI